MSIDVENREPSTIIRISVCVSVTALVFASCGVWVQARFLARSIADVFGDQPMPRLTELLVVAHPYWPLLYPIPWILWLIVLMSKKNPKVDDALLMIATVLLGLCVLITAFVTASVLPWLPHVPKLK